VLASDMDLKNLGDKHIIIAASKEEKRQAYKIFFKSKLSETSLYDLRRYYESVLECAEIGEPLVIDGEIFFDEDKALAFAEAVIEVLDEKLSSFKSNKEKENEEDDDEELSSDNHKEHI
jgi:hypothetical protein